MIGYNFLYAMGCGRVVAWFFCWRTCSRTFISSNVDSMYTILYGNIVILFHDIPGTRTCTCAYVTYSSERFMRDCWMIHSDIYWGYHTFHPFPSPVFHACVYMFFICVQPAVLGGGGIGKYCIQCFTAQPDSVCLAQYFTVTVTVGGLIGILRKIVGRYS
jgi:hypothetical protein